MKYDVSVSDIYGLNSDVDFQDLLVDLSPYYIPSVSSSTAFFMNAWQKNPDLTGPDLTGVCLVYRLSSDFLSRPLADIESASGVSIDGGVKFLHARAHWKQ